MGQKQGIRVCLLYFFVRAGLPRRFDNVVFGGSGRENHPAGTNESLVLVVSMILGWSGFVPVLLPEEVFRGFMPWPVPCSLLPESGHARQDAFAWDTSGIPELSLWACLPCNDHALGVLHLPADDEAVEVHAGLQFAAPDD